MRLCSESAHGGRAAGVAQCNLATGNSFMRRHLPSRLTGRCLPEMHVLLTRQHDDRKLVEGESEIPAHGPTRQDLLGFAQGGEAGAVSSGRTGTYWLC